IAARDVPQLRHHIGDVVLVLGRVEDLRVGIALERLQDDERRLAALAHADVVGNEHPVPAVPCGEDPQGGVYLVVGYSATGAVAAPGVVGEGRAEGCGDGRGWHPRHRPRLNYKSGVGSSAGRKPVCIWSKDRAMICRLDLMSALLRVSRTGLNS